MTRAEIVVEGAGPAGMSAAVRAAECSRGVMVLDDNAAPQGDRSGAAARRMPGAGRRQQWFACVGAYPAAGDCERRTRCGG